MTQNALHVYQAQKSAESAQAVVIHLQEALRYPTRDDILFQTTLHDFKILLASLTIGDPLQDLSAFNVLPLLSPLSGTNPEVIQVMQELATVISSSKGFFLAIYEQLSMRSNADSVKENDDDEAEEVLRDPKESEIQASRFLL